MKKALLIVALAIAASACALGQVDRSKEVKPVIVERPAVEHFYSCPDGYELKRFVPKPAYGVLTYATSAIYPEPVDHYEDAPAKDILRNEAEPTCVPKLGLIFLKSISLQAMGIGQVFVFSTADGKEIKLHMDTGKVDLPAGYPADKAAKEFWEFLKRYSKGEYIEPVK